MKKTLATLAAAAIAAAPALADPLTAPLECGDCASWNEAKAPVHLYGGSWYVGVGGLASVLIATKDGLILIDGDLPQSAPLIEANLKKLGHDMRDVKLILVSHEHFDHVGGIAALQRDSGARVLAGAAAAQALKQGHPTAADPQYDPHDQYSYPVVTRVKTVEDGQTVTLGDVTVTAHRTPGHTPGGTSWSWKSCESGRCLDMVYSDSLTAFSTAPGYRFTPVAESFRASIAKVRALPCDILVTTHPGASDFWKRAEAGKLVDPEACRALADRAEAALDRRLAQEK
jgi:metallo-beta-lactamase class B